MALATGIPVNDLLDLDEAMLLTLREVYENSWTRSEHLIATVVDAVQIAAYNALVGPHADPKKLRNVKAPKPIERPHLRRKKRKATVAEMVELFGAGGHVVNPKESAHA